MTQHIIIITFGAASFRSDSAINAGESENSTSSCVTDQSGAGIKLYDEETLADGGDLWVFGSN